MKKTVLFLCVSVLCACAPKPQIQVSVEKWSHERGLDRNLVYAVIRWESGFRNTWRSDRRTLEDREYVRDAIRKSLLLQRRGRVAYRSCGLMQVNYLTAYHYGFTNGFAELMSVDTNVRIGTECLSYYLGRFGNVKEGLCAYNGGAEAVYRMRRTGRVPEYVRLVYGTYTNWSRGRNE